VKRGDIWIVAGGAEFTGKPRPVAVLQDDRFAELGSITLCPFTTKMCIRDRFKHDKRITFGKIDDYVLGRVPDRFRVFKLHGSVNWGRCLTSGPSVVTQSQQARGPWGSAEIMIENAAALGLSDDYCVVTDDKAGFVGPPLFPAIAIPVVSKATFECPPAHVDMLRNLIPEVDRILAIGWRANERDFLNMLRDMNAASIVTMCGPHSGDTLERLRGLSFRVKPNPMALDGFSRSVTDSRLNAFLAGDSFAKRCV